jgi:thiol-disulfide isomerase/thioredoxin
MFKKLAVKAAIAASVAFVITSGAYAEDLFSGLGVIRPKVRVEAPPFTLASLGGGERSLEDFEGKVILLNFWATHCEPCREEMPILLNFWATHCEPCREEMPAMERLWKELKDRGLVIIAVAGDRGFWSKSRVEKFIKTLGVTFPVLLDPRGDVRRTYEVAVLPTSYLIGKDGKFLGKVVGERLRTG